MRCKASARTIGHVRRTRLQASDDRKTRGFGGTIAIGVLALIVQAVRTRITCFGARRPATAHPTSASRATTLAPAAPRRHHSTRPSCTSCAAIAAAAAVAAARRYARRRRRHAVDRIGVATPENNRHPDDRHAQAKNGNRFVHERYEYHDHRRSDLEIFLLAKRTKTRNPCDDGS